MPTNWFTTPSRLRTLLIGLVAGVLYGLCAMAVASSSHRAVSIAYIFVLPVVLGAIPALYSSREQLSNYLWHLVAPWLMTFTLFTISFISGFEGLICLVVIFGPFVILGSLGAFFSRRVSQRDVPNKPLYVSLIFLLPFMAGLVEEQASATDQFYTVTTTQEIVASRAVVWQNIQSVRHIQPREIKPHFVHLIGVPRPLDGRLDSAGVGGIRHIRWEKGLYFQEHITAWNPGQGFAYDIKVNPHSIPPRTLDEHVLVGGQYFDVVRGSYGIQELAAERSLVTLTCTYRVTTNLNGYSKLWADFMLDDFNKMILEVIQSRCERLAPL